MLTTFGNRKNTFNYFLLFNYVFFSSWINFKILPDRLSRRNVNASPWGAKYAFQSLRLHYNFVLVVFFFLRWNNCGLSRDLAVEPENIFSVTVESNFRSLSSSKPFSASSVGILLKLWQAFHITKNILFTGWVEISVEKQAKPTF